MSKPLVFVLQLVGLFMILGSIGGESGAWTVNWFWMIAGAALAVAGGAGFRKRVNK